jgi:FkbH-like protein
MLLREEHIAVFQANWNDKATNITAIAKELSLGLDALVFLDDNPVERGLVREVLPEVAVPEVGDDPALFARTLAAAGYFEAIHFSDEDRKRAEMYQGNARRLGLEKQAVDVDSYLTSLDMQIVFRPFDEIGRSRIAQLISKSNQFNLTTRRYAEADIAELERDPAVHTLQVRLVDKFGDNGMISVIICRLTEPDTWTIDTWLMSCRVLGRRVEQAVLREIVESARASGIRHLIGVYRPTPRNAMVSDHYSKLGFTRLDDASLRDNETRWSLPTSAQIAAPPMRVDRLSALLVETGA